MRLWITYTPCAVLPDYLGNNCQKTFSHTKYKQNFFQIFCSLADELLVGKINCIFSTVFDCTLSHKIWDSLYIVFWYLVFQLSKTFGGSPHIRT